MNAKITVQENDWSRDYQLRGKGVEGAVSLNYEGTKSNPWPTLYNLQISPVKHRRKGYGTQLLTYVLSDLKEKGYKKVRLYVTNNNLPALALYTKLGFTFIIKDKSQYSSTEAIKEL